MTTALGKKIVNMLGLEEFASKTKTYIAGQITEVKKLIEQSSGTDATTDVEVNAGTITQNTYIDCTHSGGINSLEVTNAVSNKYELVVHFTANATNWSGLTFTNDYKVLGDSADFVVEAGGEYELSIRNNIATLCDISSVTV